MASKTHKVNVRTVEIPAVPTTAKSNHAAEKADVLLELLETGDLSDMQLVVAETRYTVHKIILASAI